MTADRLIAGRYRLTDPIGTGAMGVVWRGTDVRLRRTVAVKQLILGPGLSREAALEAKLRAMREGRIAARLHHPNAITVFDVAEEDGQPWLVMEYMDAPSLAAKLSGKRTLAPAEVARIGAQAAGALAAAHKAGIMHRDVKPANLLVGDDGTVKLTDFGISRAVGDVTVTATGFLAGTPAYLAPEVARGENPEPASDVFALGSTLYAAVEGQPPFGEGDNPLAVLHAVARGQVPEPKQAGVLGSVLMRLLAPTIDARPTMREAQQALEAVAEGRVPKLGTPSLTKALPAPGADATTVLPQPGTDAASSTANATAATALVPTAALANAAPQANPAAAESVSAQPPIPPRRAATTIPGGAGGGPQRNRAMAVGAAAFVAVLLVIGLVAYIVNGDRKDEGGTAAPSVTTVSAAPEGPPPPANAASTGQEAPPAPVSTPEPSPPPSPTPAPSSTTPTPTPTPSPTPSKAPPTTVTATPFGPPPAASVAQFIQGYYSMLPGNTSAAWSQLTPSYQAQTGGYDAYVRFWSAIQAVSVGSVTPSGESRATASITYTMKSGERRSESRWFQVVSENGRMLIAGSGA
ncbi:serine/threonine-protein kinase [Nocardia iowensis]|uniref:non-specific serine/threonine protein kinase n=1 Tax=Nocardia iowensis TaxID=204891 RepID=A0ABX8RHK0_NOCIO|nr:serine/threonine-protein kinase [Nocardia iowensis]QXN89053.1 serine/threonine protein kinase [Nocardia iowensis]